MYIMVTKSSSIMNLVCFAEKMKIYIPFIGQETILAFCEGSSGVQKDISINISVTVEVKKMGKPPFVLIVNIIRKIVSLRFSLVFL